jgi:hypothetical protein
MHVKKTKKQNGGCVNLAHKNNKRTESTSSIKEFPAAQHISNLAAESDSRSKKQFKTNL